MQSRSQSSPIVTEISSSQVVSAEFINLDEVLFELLAKLDNEKAAQRVSERLSKWSGSFYTFPTFVQEIDKHFGSRFADKVIEVLGDMVRKSDRSFGLLSSQLSTIIRFSWKVPKDVLLKWGGDELDSIF